MQYSKKGIPEMLQKLEETLIAMYKKWRQVLRSELSTTAPE